MKTKNKKNKIKKIKFNNVAEWLQLRKNFICASEVSVVMNHNKFKSLENLYNEKINDEKVEQTESMRWGLLLEKTIANEWALINDVKIHKKNFVYVYDDTLLATPDFFASKNKQKFLIEIKNTSKFFFDHSLEIDGIPQMYYDQIQTQLLCTNLNFAYLVALLDGKKLIEKKIEANSEYQKIIYEKAKEFLDLHIKTKIPPKQIAENEIQNELNFRFANEDDLALYKKYKEVSNKIKTLEEEKKQIKEEIKNLLNEFSAIYYKDKKLYGKSENYIFDSDEFKKEFQILYEQFKTKKVEKIEIAKNLEI